MIIAIYGKSCTGKTAIAQTLSRYMACEVHHCGEEVKKSAEELNCPFKDLEQKEHGIIDQKTRVKAQSVNGNIIIEGTFLPYVLRKLDDVIWIELVCDDGIRNKRFFKREGIKDLKSRDYFDKSLCDKLYKKSIILTNNTVIDTTNSSIDELSKIIFSQIIPEKNNAYKT